MPKIAAQTLILIPGDLAGVSLTVKNGTAPERTGHFSSMEEAQSWADNNVDGHVSLVSMTYAVTPAASTTDTVSGASGETPITDADTISPVDASLIETSTSF
ncbi:hypothetical protein SAMN05216548_10528 [Faunimonas pinastri]|uniref:Uncharacterized protein n=1 Tax=Faunimonas pinastri TaxID=1855383 RepID=A0A1H9GFY2_9HYPH|nr:hypothetical protein [Faunimonas pinastri]SEQ49035.1 hypothetical protein SAMN05216548_10528 [Faunimonas pinastri]